MLIRITLDGHHHIELRFDKHDLAACRYSDGREQWIERTARPAFESLFRQAGVSASTADELQRVLDNDPEPDPIKRREAQTLVDDARNRGL